MNVTKSSSSSSSSTSYFAAAVRPSITVATAPMPLAFPVPPSISVHTMHVDSSATEEAKGKDTDDYYRAQQEQDRLSFKEMNQYHHTTPTSMVGSIQSGTNNQQGSANNNNMNNLGARVASEVANTRVCEAASVKTIVDNVTMATVQECPGDSGANASADSGDMLLNGPKSSFSSLPRTMATSSVSAATDRDHTTASDASSHSSLAALLANADAQIQTLGVRSRSPSPPPPPPHAAAATVTASAMQHAYVKSADTTAPTSHYSQLPTVPSSSSSSSSSSRRFADNSSPVVPRLSTLLKATSDARKDSGMAVNTTEGNSLEEVEDEIRRRLKNIGAALSPGKKRSSPNVAITAAAAVSRNASSALGWGLLKKSLEMQEAEEIPTRPSPSQRQLQAASTYMALHSAHNRTKTTTGTPPGTNAHRGGGFGGRSTSASPSSSSSRISPSFNDRKLVPPLPAGSPLTRGTGNASNTMSMFRRGSPDVSGSVATTTTAAAGGTRGVRSARSNSPVVRASSTTSTTSTSFQRGRPKPPSMAMSPSSLANESRLDDFLGKLGRYIDEQDTEERNDADNGDDGDDNDSNSEDSLLNGLHVAFPNPHAPAPPQQKEPQSFLQEESDESYETPDSIVGSMLGHPTTT